MAAAGGSFSLFCGGGNVWGTGRNSRHFGFDGVQQTITSPKLLPISDIESVSVGEYHSLFLDSSGGAWSCGIGIDGQLGSQAIMDENNCASITKIELPTIKTIHARPYSSLFIDVEDSVWAFSRIYDGDKLRSSTGTTVKVQDLPPVAAVCGGSSHTMYLDINGIVWGVGDNSYGQAGVSSPGLILAGKTQVVNVPRIKSFAAGLIHSVLLDENGGVWICGQNTFGQLGTGWTTRQKGTLHQVTNLPPIQSVRAGAYQTFLIDTSGNVWATGRNAQNQLPLVSYGDVTSFTKIQNLPPIYTVSAYNHCLFTDNSGDVWAFGENKYGELGLGNVESPKKPVVIPSMNVRTKPHSRTKSARKDAESFCV